MKIKIFFKGFIITILSSVVGSLISNWLLGSIEKTKEFLGKLLLGTALFIPFTLIIIIVCYLILRKQISKANEERILEEAKKLMKRIMKEKKELSKDVFNAKKELKAIIQDLKILFDRDVSYSLIKLFENVKIDIGEIMVIMEWFHSFFNRYDDSESTGGLAVELNSIILKTQLAINKFYEHVKKCGWDERTKNLYSQTKVKYDSIISNRLESFINRELRKSNAEFQTHFDALRDVATL